MRTIIEISQQALSHNIQIIKQLCTNSQLAPVIKSNAYGHGQLEVARILDTIPSVTFLCVAHAQEALQLKHSKISKQLLTLAYVHDNFAELIKEDIHVTVYDYEQLAALNTVAKTIGKKVYVHIKIDTGMCRLGFTPEDTLRILNNPPEHIKIYGICTHLNDKDSHDLSYTKNQLTQLQKISTLSEKKLLTHGLSSGALDLSQEYPCDIVRPGTNLYGFWSSDESKKRAQAQLPGIDFKPIATWKCSILQIKNINKGSYIGYNRTFCATRDMIIAILPIGYADGYPRQLSNRGTMHIRNYPVPIVGLVSMNLIVIDVTYVPQLTYQDQVIMYDHNPETSVEKAANHLETIAIELTTRINPEIPRLII